ncbi:DUF484 family protein [Saccharospirillum salsuginis]|uniref:DUF484 family protein n=1 Tax=Saccharospirillum salsuginis TaxID=418750 RepID=A0A918KC80_9GAMM|nr:DUF484 family protein [Saccharospirillum salsuginis]GGX58270.1 hypothetical protein GCM10007392_27600 [Saccharospirillum salsuginis]
MTETLSDNDLSPEAVAHYLRRHPRFFEDHPNLLKKLHLRHDAGEAISLMERQNQILRQENRQLIDRLNHFIQVAQRNDRLFLQLQRLVLDLLSQAGCNDLLSTLQQGLVRDFDVHETTVILCDRPNQDGDAWLQIDRDTLAGHYPKLVHERKALCGGFDEEERNFLFAGLPVQSIALAPLERHGEVNGLLALGHHSAEHFRSGTDTLFLTHLASVISELLGRMGDD